MKVGSRLAITLALLGVALVPGHVRAEPFYVYLSFDLSGTGSGTVRTLTALDGVPDNQIDCRIVDGYVDPREACDQQYDAGDDHVIRVFFEIVPAAGSCRYATGCLENRIATYVDVDPQDVRYEVEFNHVIYPVSATTSGAGTVTSSDGEIVCGAACSNPWEFGTSVTLTATPDIGATFTGWAGACAGQDASCDLVVSGPTTTKAFFELIPAPTPSPSPQATPRSTRAPPASEPPPAPSVAATPLAPASGEAVSSEAASPAAAPTGPATPAPIDPAGGTAPADRTPVALAILAVGVLIAGMIGFAALRRRKIGG